MIPRKPGDLPENDQIHKYLATPDTRNDVIRSEAEMMKEALQIRAHILKRHHAKLELASVAPHVGQGNDVGPDNPWPFDVTMNQSPRQ